MDSTSNTHLKTIVGHGDQIRILRIQLLRATGLQSRIISNISSGNFDRETNQVNQTIQAKIGVESKEDAPVGYLLDLGYTNFSHKYALSKEQDGPTEHTFDVKFDLNARFGGEQRIGLGGNVEYFNYSLPTMGGQEYLEFENHAEATLSPYYKVSGDNWNLKLGANIMFVTGDNSKFMASPNITADVEVADKTELYLVAGGKLYSNSMYEISQVNRYINPTMELLPSRNYLDGTVGIRSGIAPGFWFDVFGGYKITSDEVFFAPTLLAPSVQGDILPIPVELCKQMQNMRSAVSI